MSIFNTHGGYFAPKDYMRIDTGGSHEENPNGGVQVGVDEQGIPNLLEEGEPVYKDYVFSDNIKADKQVLDDNSLPVSYTGKLFSEIADSFIDEAETRPNDPISRKGLEAMLSRLAQAQEQQKQTQMMVDLEEQLSQLTPEDLASLEAELTSTEQPVDPYVPAYSEPVAQEQILPEQMNVPVMRCGGKINRFDVGGWADFLNTVRGYKPSLTPGNLAGKYAIDRGFDLHGFNTLRDLEQSQDYQNFTNYVLANSDNQDVQNYLRALDAGTAAGVTKLFDGNALRSDWQDLYRNRRYDNKAGIYHLYDTNLIPTAEAAPVSDMLTPAIVTADRVAPKFREYNSIQAMANELYGKPKKPDLSGYRTEVAEENLDEPLPGEKPVGAGVLPTFPRYAKAIGAGLLGMYNAFQKPDHYTASRAVPYSPYGNINLQNQRYVAIDPNTVLNTQLAQANNTARAIQNNQSPSTTAGLLALDNNTTRNVGTGLLQTIQANNQQRNAVIGANNAAETQRAQFDYNVDRGRVMGLDMAKRQNLHNELLLQQLNNEAEGQKYQALSNQINTGLDALAGIGQENFVMNQINSNTALNGYRLAPNGIGGYMLVPREKKSCGGLLKKYKK